MSCLVLPLRQLEKTIFIGNLILEVAMLPPKNKNSRTCSSYKCVTALPNALKHHKNHFPRHMNEDQWTDDVNSFKKILTMSIIIKMIKHRQLHIAVNCGTMARFHPNATFPTRPFSFQLGGSHSPSHYSGGKPSFPITTRCIPVYLHCTWMAHICARGISPIRSHTGPAGLITTSVFVLRLVFLPAVTSRLVGAVERRRQLKEHDRNFCRNTQTRMHPRWHRGRLVGGRSRQLNVKARITGQRTLRCSHTHIQTHIRARFLDAPL